MSEQSKWGELTSNGRLLLGCFLGLAVGVSSLYFYTIGLFLKPLAAEFGWSRGAASLGPLIAILTIGFVAPLAGRLVDHYGARRVAFASSLAFACAFGLLGWLTAGLLSFLALTCLLSVCANGTSPVSYARLVVSSIKGNLGFALGLVYSGTGFGAIFAPLIVERAITAFGWRGAYLVLAAFTVLISPVVASLLRPSRAVEPETPAQNSWSWGLFAEPRFLVLALVFLLCSVGLFGTVVHLVPMLTDRGVPPIKAASYAGLLGFAVIGGRLMTGYLLDKFDAGRLTLTVFTSSGLGMLLLAGGQPELVLPGTLMLGFTIGTEFDLAAYLVGRRFPVENFSVLFGGIYAAVSLGGGAGPLIAGLMFDHTGGYGTWLVLAAAVVVLAGVLALTPTLRTARPRSATV